MNSLPATHQAIIFDRPAWATAGFAVGVFGGALGCVLLMLGQRACLLVFLLSLAGIVATVIHMMNVAISGVKFSVFETVVMGVIPIIVALALLAYARHAVAKYSGRSALAIES